MACHLDPMSTGILGHNAARKRVEDMRERATCRRASTRGSVPDAWLPKLFRCASEDDSACPRLMYRFCSHLARASGSCHAQSQMSHPGRTFNLELNEACCQFMRPKCLVVRTRPDLLLLSQEG